MWQQATGRLSVKCYLHNLGWISDILSLVFEDRHLCKLLAVTLYIYGENVGIWASLPYFLWALWNWGQTARIHCSGVFHFHCEHSAFVLFSSLYIDWILLIFMSTVKIVYLEMPQFRQKHQSSVVICVCTAHCFRLIKAKTVFIVINCIFPVKSVQQKFY